MVGVGGKKKTSRPIPRERLNSSTTTENSGTNAVQTPSPRRSPASDGYQHRLPIPVTPTGSTISAESSPIQREERNNSNAVSGSVSYDMKAFMDEQRSFNERMLNFLSAEKEHDSQPRARTRKERLSLGITSSVRTVYKNIQESDANSHWDFEKSFVSPENASVNSKVTEGVRSTDKTASPTIIRDAIRAHFKTKKRQYVMAKKSTKMDYLKQQRSRSRMNTKRLQRHKALSNSTTINEEDKENIKLILTNAFMSSDESMSDSSDREEDDESDSNSENTSKSKVLVLKTLAWRSERCNNILKRLDKRVQKRRSQKGVSMVMPRRVGPPSSRLQPDDAPEWAIAEI